MKKFSVTAAFEMIERYLIERKLHPRWYVDLSLSDPKISELMDSGYHLALPQKDQYGRQLMIYRFSKLDANKFTSSDAIRLNNLIFSYYLLQEVCQGKIIMFNVLDP